MSRDAASKVGEPVYPDCDGQPMADNTLQFQWIVVIKENLDVRVADFVAGDLLWYPVEGHPEIRRAPDVLVALGRPKGYRGSYKQWEEGGVAPQVVFEVLSPGNRNVEMVRKYEFYRRYGVEEYYLYDPDHEELSGWIRRGDLFVEVDTMNGFISPRLGIRFRMSDTLELFDAEGHRFETFSEIRVRAEEEKARAEEEKARAEEEKARADQEKARADQEKARADALAEKLRTAGMDPEL